MRKILVSLLLSVALLIVLIGNQAGAKATHRATSEQQVLNLLNEIRTQHGLSAFTVSTQLRSAARGHSDDMLIRDYFDHDSPTEAWDVRISRYLKSSMIGEDIAWGTGSYATAQAWSVSGCTRRRTARSS